MTPVIISPAARTDLMDIADYIAGASPRTALEFVDKLEERCLKIGASPESYRLRPELAAGLRSVVFSAYLVFYRVEANAVRIERILHGSRNLPEVDFG